MAKETLRLKKLLDNDSALKEDKEKYMLFKSMATLYEGDLKNNLNADSFDLQQKYDELEIGPSEWVDFLSYPTVAQFVQKFQNEQMRTAASNKLKEIDKTSDALKLKEYVDKQEVKEDNSNIIVMFLPQRW